MIIRPIVSVVMSTYNDSNFIKEAIESVFRQKFKNWEFIVINDASTDNTDAILKKYQEKDKRIIYINNVKNKGLIRNLNLGLDRAKGDFIARLDGDDSWTDVYKLQRQVEYLLDNPDCGLVGTFAYATDQFGKKLYEIEYPIDDTDIRKIILRHGPFVHSSVLLRRKTLLAIGKYNKKHLYSEDYDLYLKLGKVSKLHNIPSYMVNYRINPLGISTTKYLEQHNEAVKIISKYRQSYSGFYLGLFLWNLRKLYPLWFRGAISRTLKKSLFLQRL